jgi:hypothetical protein
MTLPAAGGERKFSETAVILIALAWYPHSMIHILLWSLLWLHSHYKMTELAVFPAHNQCRHYGTKVQHCNDAHSPRRRIRVRFKICVCGYILMLVFASVIRYAESAKT